MVVMFWTMAAAFAASLLRTSPVFAQEKPRIYLGASSKTLGYSPLWVATRKGLFRSARNGRPTGIIARHADDRASAGRELASRWLGWAGTLYRSFGARTRFRCHRRHYQRKK